MSNNINRMRKNKSKGKSIFVAAALTAVLIAGNNMPVVTESVSAAESRENTAGSLIPDNITIDQSVELANVELPATEYGSFEWADGSFVPTQRVQSCEVLLIPAKGQDLSNADGWDPEAGAVIGYINVIVNSIVDSDNAGEIEDTDQTEDAEISVTPVLSEKPAADDVANEAENVANEENQSDKENKDNKAEEDKKHNDDKKDENKNKDGEENNKDSEVTGKLELVDDAVQDEDETTKDDVEDNIFDNPVLPDNEDDRPTDAEDSMSDEEKEKRASVNHTCNGITVSGVNLPWYVQFRVSSGDSYQFTNESDAMIFQSYEFELWNLQNNTEYEIPSGDYISVTVPVKSGYQYTIEHLLDNGATETIIPSVENDIMVFSTHSFSPFGIAGSKQLVGPETGSDTDDTDAVTPATGSSNTQTSDAGNSNTVSMNNTSENSDSSSSSGQEDASAQKDAAKNNDTVNTGDTTPIMPFVILVVAAAVIIGAVIFIKKKKK